MAIRDVGQYVAATRQPIASIGVVPIDRPSDVECPRLSPSTHTCVGGTVHAPSGPVDPTAQRSARIASSMMTWPLVVVTSSPGSPITRLTRFNPDPAGSSNTTMSPRRGTPVRFRARIQSPGSRTGAIEFSVTANRLVTPRNSAAIATDAAKAPAIARRLDTIHPLPREPER